jgi:hypothetical protein
MIFITSISSELEAQTAPNASTIIGRLLNETVARALDTHVFDSQPADTTRPAGLLNGVTPLTVSHRHRFGGSHRALMTRKVGPLVLNVPSP